LLRILCERTQGALRGTELQLENALKWETLHSATKKLIWNEEMKEWRD